MTEEVFSWSETMKELDTVRAELRRGKQIFSAFAKVDDELLDKAQRLSEKLGGVEDIVADLRTQKAALEAEIVALELNKANLQKWDSLTREHLEKEQREMGEDLERNRQLYQQEIVELSKAHESSKAEMARELEDLQSTLRRDIAALGEEAEQAEARLAQVRQQIGTLAQSAREV